MDINSTTNGSGLYAFLAIIGIFIIYFIVKNMRKPKDSSEETLVADKIDSIQTTQVSKTDDANPMNDNELVAVISAAIACCMGSTSNIIVRNIVRVGDSTPAWAQAGKNDQMASRF